MAIWGNPSKIHSFLSLDEGLEFAKRVLGVGDRLNHMYPDQSMTKETTKKNDPKKKKCVFFGIATTGSSWHLDEIIQIVAVGPSLDEQTFEDNVFNMYVKPSKVGLHEDEGFGIKYENGKFSQRKLVRYDEVHHSNVVKDIGQGLKEFHSWLLSKYGFRVTICSFDGKDFHLKFLRRALDEHPDAMSMRDLYSLECVDVKEAIQHKVMNFWQYTFKDLLEQILMYKDVVQRHSWPDVPKPWLNFIGRTKEPHLWERLFNDHPNHLICLEEYVRLTREFSVISSRILGVSPARFLWFKACLLDDIWAFKDDDFGRSCTMVPDRKVETEIELYPCNVIRTCIHKQ